MIKALSGQSLDRPPIWFMRQAGRYLPEYRELRSRHSFEEAMSTPSLAAEITLQPLRRFPLDAAIVFSDITTPLVAMGVEVEFAPGPRLHSHDVNEVANLGEFDPSRVDFVAETISLVRASLDPEVTLIGFAGGPATVLAYLMEGGGSQYFGNFRAALYGSGAERALETLVRSTRAYLQAQIEAGAQVVQLFDTWAGLVSRDQFRRWVLPAARDAISGLGVPTIYFAPGANHLLDLFHLVGATAYGVDWRIPLRVAWGRVGERFPLQGNLDPALLLADPDQVRAGTIALLKDVDGRPGHVFGLGHGILPTTPLAGVEAMVHAVTGWRGHSIARAKEAV
jgi:uroporphyrinogen decarboxylase